MTAGSDALPPSCSVALSEREFHEGTSIGGQLKRMTGDVDLAAEQSIRLAEPERGTT